MYAGCKGASRAPTGRLPQPRRQQRERTVPQAQCTPTTHPSTLRRDRLGLVQGTQLVRAEARPEPRCSDSRSGTRGCRKPWPPSRGLRGDGMAGHHPHPVLECLPSTPIPGGHGRSKARRWDRRRDPPHHHHLGRPTSWNAPTSVSRAATAQERHGYRPVGQLRRLRGRCPEAAVPGQVCRARCCREWLGSRHLTWQAPAPARLPVRGDAASGTLPSRNSAPVSGQG